MEYFMLVEMRKEREESTMKGKQRLVTLLIAMLFGAVLVGTNVVPANAPLPPAEGTLDLIDVHDNDHNASALLGHETDTMPLWKDFNLKVMITNVTNYYAIVFSCAWNPSELDLTTITAGDSNYNATKTMFGPSQAEWNHVTGILREWGYGQLGADNGSVKSYTGGTWGWVATLKFKWVGASPPSVPSPINTYINITYVEDGHKTGWYHLWKGRTPFVVRGQCKFHYYTIPHIPVPPTASFNILGTPPYYVNEIVDFDASASTGGDDGDGPTVITELHWNFGDGNVSVYKGGNFTYTPSHNYTSTGSLTVSLYVVAPPVGWFLPSYVNTSTTVSKPLTISALAVKFLDVYTENERWPPHSPSYYITLWNGTGPGVPAEAYSPQENVTLYALAWWNDDAVQNKLVKFLVEGPKNPAIPPTDWIVFKRTATTNATGIATITFRIPWPCTSPYAEQLIFGTWIVYASVSMAEIEFTDNVTFKVGWIVEITGVQTVNGTCAPETIFKKGQCIGVEVNVTNIAYDPRQATIGIVVYDDAGAVIAEIQWVGVWIPAGNTTYCVQFWCYLRIPKWAYTGPNCMVYVNAYTPSVPWCPEVSAGPFTITV